MRHGWQKTIRVAVGAAMALCLWVPLSAGGGQEQKPAAAAPAPATSAAQPAAATKPFYLHALHATQLGLDCSTCHTPVKEGSVALQRPGHDQCMACHADAFGDKLDPKICEQCHTAFPPTSSDDNRPFPRYKGLRSILIDFSHAKHTDPKARIDAHTGMRGDCSFCHKFDVKGAVNSFPMHEQCASCHSKPGMVPNLSPASTTADCRGCHNPEGIENPAAAPVKKAVSLQVISGKYGNIKFSHQEHFKYAQQNGMTCETCHSGVEKSTGLADLSLPKMSDCVGCHQMQKTMQTAFRMTNCTSCHVDGREGPVPSSHSQLAKPAWHTNAFRTHHQEQAAAPGANCFVCHTNVVARSASLAGGGGQCASCHSVMRPVSHTLRWRDDIHGKYAAIDRESCATCHAADYCSRCHNETPRSHMPLALFKGGAHARLAMLNERSCLTCHTFQNTCAECHSSKLR